MAPSHPRKLIRAAWLALLCTLGTLAGCQDDVRVLAAKRATSRYELVGGPVAYADVGDFVLENDKVRIAILGSQQLAGGPERSWGPGVFGGSLVDADLRRDDARYPPGSGRDRFAEVFPFANLLVPAPIGHAVTVVADGSDGKTATIRVEGKGRFLFEGLGVLKNNKDLLNSIGFKGVKTDVHFRTDYSLHPGDRFVTMKTWVILDDTPDADVVGGENTCNPQKSTPDGGNPACAAGLSCQPLKPGAAVDDPLAKAGTCACRPLPADCAACPLAHAVDANGCQVCACSESLPMTLATGGPDESVFGIILGDNFTLATRQKRAGIGAGDFVFFGNQNDIFVPGHGFDEEKPIWDALFGNRDTFARPLGFDFVAAAGGDVSYGYFTKTAAGAPDPKVLVPVFTSAATAFVSASLGCSWNGGEDDPCRKSHVYEFERYLAIGDGDIASIYDTLVQVRGSAHGTVQGMVRWQESGAAAVNATVFVLQDPKPGTAWQTADQVIDAHRLLDGSPGVVNAIDADAGLDLQEDGDFHASLAPGDYVLVAMDEKKIVVGPPLRVHIDAGKTVIAAPSLPTPARIRIRATDGTGAGLPAKATIVKLDAHGQPLWRDGGRRPYFGQGRLGSGVQSLGYAMDGRFDAAVEAGDYQVVVSHGVEFGITRKNLTVEAGGVANLDAVLARQVDTTGWISGDFHLHAEPSFDSGLPLDQRVRSIAAEGVDYCASTDHDVLSNYLPFIRQLGLDRWLQAVVGAEVSTLEIGHYIGFPLAYDQDLVPHHGSVDWFCKPSNSIVADIVSRSGFTSGADKPTTIIAHPRDGFLGWLSQAGVNPFSLTRKLSQLESANPVLRTVACDFDAFELFNGKRFDLVHTATLREVQTFSRCLARIDRAALDSAGKQRRLPGEGFDEAAARANLAKACPELADRGLTDLVKCPEGEDFFTCQHRYRIALGRVLSTDILRRTPEEAKAWLEEPTSTDPAEAAKLQDKLGVAGLCAFDASKLDTPLDQLFSATDLDRPCTDKQGVLEDEFRFLEHGFVHTMVGGSDSHGPGIEPGTPRTFIRSSHDDPGDLDPAEIAKNLRAGQVVASYGPFLQVDVAGQGPGATLKAEKNGKVSLHMKVQTPAWFGIDRYEVYVNGLLVQAEDLTVAVDAIVDLDKTIEVAVSGRDSWIVVKVLGTQEEHLMRPVYLDVPFGELQLPRVAAIAFSNLPIINAQFPPPAKVPDFYPIYPLAVSNPIFLDTDGNGRYDAPLPAPAFCSPPCDPATGVLVGSQQKCSDIQADYKCLTPENRCGLDIPGVCDIYQAQKAGALRGMLGGH